MLSEHDLQKLNEQSVGNMELFEQEQKCGCFFCGKIFGSVSTKEIAAAATSTHQQGKGILL